MTVVLRTRSERSSSTLLSISPRLSPMRRKPSSPIGTSSSEGSLMSKVNGRSSTVRSVRDPSSPPSRICAVSPSPSGILSSLVPE